MKFRLFCFFLFQFFYVTAGFLWDEGFKKCYGELGCFDLGGDFRHRPVQLLPLSPDVIKARFLLNTRLNPTQHQILDYKSEFSVKKSHFDGKKKTKFIVHGYIDYGTRKWLMDLSKEFLTYEDCNVIRVDWGAGSKIPYTQASANTRVVGAEIALLIKRLGEWTGADPKDVHILGHSLGSHIAGYAGERTPGLGWITGLDPAEPYFQGYGPGVILDKTDAEFVEAIHTDGESIYNIGNDIGTGDKGFGMSDPVGHVDFYPNGGFQQPGCQKTAVEKIIAGGFVTGLEDAVACSHMRVTRLYIEAINSHCPFMAYNCSSNQNFRSGHCLSCHYSGLCTQMGPKSRELTPQMRQVIEKGDKSLVLFFTTGDATPYCRYNHRIDVGVSYKRGDKVKGQIYSELVGNEGRTGEVKLSKSVEHFYPGERHLYLVTTVSPIGNISSVHFWWESSSFWPPFQHPKLYLRDIRVNDDFHSVVEYCGYNDPIETGKKYKTVLFTANTTDKRCKDFVSRVSSHENAMSYYLKQKKILLLRN